MAPTITPAEHLRAHVRKFCADNDLKFFVVTKPAEGELEFKVCKQSVKFTQAEISATGANLVELVAARIKAVMP